MAVCAEEPTQSELVGREPTRSISNRPGVDYWQSIASGNFAPARIVTAFLRDGNRVLLCHRSAKRSRYPDVWDLPGGHVEPGELPGASLVRELREELGIDIAPPMGPALHETHAAAFDMQVWLIETWTGTPANVALDEHDAIAWFAKDELGELRLAHDRYLAMFTEALSEQRA